MTPSGVLFCTVETNSRPWTLYLVLRSVWDVFLLCLVIQLSRAVTSEQRINVVEDTWRHGRGCLLPLARLWLRTQRPWSTKTTGLIMWVHGIVVLITLAGRDSRAGQMRGKGQWGYVILIRGDFRRVCEARLQTRRQLADRYLPSVQSSILPSLSSPLCACP